MRIGSAGSPRTLGCCSRNVAIRVSFNKTYSTLFKIAKNIYKSLIKTLKIKKHFKMSITDVRLSFTVRPDRYARVKTIAVGAWSGNNYHHYRYRHYYYYHNYDH